MLMRLGGVVTTAIALGVALAGCGSDTGGKPTTSAPSSASSATAATATTTSAAPSAPAATPGMGMQDYFKQIGITADPVQRGQPGVPDISLPLPSGWDDAGADTPQWAYKQMIYGDPAMAADPPTITAKVLKLSGPADKDKIYGASANEIIGLPGYSGQKSAKIDKLGGYDASQIGGTYTKDGKTYAVAQKTVVIPGLDGLYVLQVRAEGTEDQLGPLLDATSAIDQQTRIKP